MKALELSSLTPIAIMPGQNPLGTPTGISHELEARIRAFVQVHGSLPTLVLVPRELRPGEALSWSAHLVLAGGLGAGQPNTSASPGVTKNQVESGGLKRAKTPSGPKSGVRHQPGREGRPAATPPRVDQEICRLSQKGLGIRAIAEVLRGEGVQVSPRTVARRLAARQGELL